MEAAILGAVARRSAFVRGLRAVRPAPLLAHDSSAHVPTLPRAALGYHGPMRPWRSLRRGLALLRARPLLVAWLLLAAVAAAAMVGVLVRRQTAPRAAAAITPDPSAPRLVFEAPPSLSGAASELRWLPASRWQPILDLVGLRDAGAPIRVLLAPEDSPLARRTPRWITGFAVPDEDTVVLLPERVLSYPHDSLAALLSHEVAHVLLARAANDGAADDGATTSGELPRWFQEGVALLAGRDLAFADRERLLLGGVTGVPPSMRQLQRAFDGEGYSIDTAYALAGALAEELVREHGRGAVPRIAAEVARGRSFAQAFAAATGEPLASFRSRLLARLPLALPLGAVPHQRRHPLARRHGTRVRRHRATPRARRGHPSTLG